MKDFLWEMEPIVLFAGFVATIVYIVAWYKPIGNVWPREGRGGPIAFLGLVPVFSMIAIIVFIVAWGHPEVKRDPFYILLYSFCGVFFTGIGSSMLTRVVDISPVSDCLHRNNIAVVFPVSAAVFASALMYSAMNMGDGDGWWCVFMPYLLLLAVWLLLAWVIASRTNVSEEITVGRNIHAGLRFGAYLLGSGTMIAIMNVGDYITFGQVILDLRYCWPVLLLSSVAFVVELACKPRPDEVHRIHAPYGSLKPREAYILTFALVAGYLLLAVVLIALFTPDIVWRLFRGLPTGYGYL
jgi:hypothetical protein